MGNDSHVDATQEIMKHPERTFGKEKLESPPQSMVLEESIAITEETPNVNIITLQTNNDHSNGDKEQNTILPSSMEGQEESKDLADS